MSYSIDTNILLYAVNTDAAEHEAAIQLMESRTTEQDLLCMTWPVLMAFQRIATHPAIFKHPLTPADAWRNIRNLLSLPRCRVIHEEEGFIDDYRELTATLNCRGNFVPDAHIATILRQHGVRRIYTADSDFRKFDFLEVVNPF